MIIIVFYCTSLISFYIIILILEPVIIVAEIKLHRLKLHSNYLLFMPGFPLNMFHTQGVNVVPPM